MTKTTLIWKIENGYTADIYNFKPLQERKRILVRAGGGHTVEELERLCYRHGDISYTYRKPSGHYIIEEARRGVGRDEGMTFEEQVNIYNLKRSKSFVERRCLELLVNDGWVKNNNILIFDRETKEWIPYEGKK